MFMYFFVASLGARHMAQPCADQYEGRVAIRKGPNHSRPVADLTIQLLNHVVGTDACPMLAKKVAIGFLVQFADGAR